MSKVYERVDIYSETHCWQYDVRMKNRQEDLRRVGLTEQEVSGLTIKDFKIHFISKENKEMCAKIVEFIKRHEWLGKMPNRPTQRYVAFYKDIIAGVVVLATPNAFSLLLGEDYKNREKLISRGACISWSPKNLASHLIMTAIRDMVRRTEFRIFTAYADPEAKELGTIYQACNFLYLGQTSGTTHTYFDSNHPERGWFSDREFRKISKYKQYAKALKIPWLSSWNTKWTVHWDKMPRLIVQAIKQEAKRYQSRCESRLSARKHKYCYLLGKSGTETKKLHRLLKERSPAKVGLSYPKIRGK